MSDYIFAGDDIFVRRRSATRKVGDFTIWCHNVDRHGYFVQFDDELRELKLVDPDVVVLIDAGVFGPHISLALRTALSREWSADKAALEERARRGHSTWYFHGGPGTLVSDVFTRGR